MTTIQIRIDEKTKKTSQKVFSQLGLDMSAGIAVYLRKVSQIKGIPFRVVTENGLTLEEEDAILKASEEAKQGKNVSPPLEGKEVVAYLKKLR